MDFSSINITNISPKKRQRYMIFILIVVVIGIGFMVWYYFLSETPAPAFEPIRPIEIRINFSVLENSLLDELQLYDSISPFEGDFGRENPFIPY